MAAVFGVKEKIPGLDEQFMRDEPRLLRHPRPALLSARLIEFERRISSQGKPGLNCHAHRRT